MPTLRTFRNKSPIQQIAWLEPFWLLGLAPVLLLADRLIASSAMALVMPLLVVLFFVGWPLRRLAYGRVSARTPLDWPLLLLAVWTPVGLWAADDWLLAWQAIGYLAFGLALYSALVNWPPARRNPAWGLLFVLPVLVGLALVGPILLSSTPVKLFRLPEFQLPFARLAASFGEAVNPNVLAGSLLLGVPLLTAMAIWPQWTKHGVVRFFCGGLALFLLVLVVLTQSRGAYAGAVAGLAAVAWLRLPRLGYVFVPVLLIGFLLSLWGPAVVRVALADNILLASLDGRVEIWQRAGYALADFPLSGVGLGNFGEVIPVFYPYAWITDGGGIPHAHNLVLQVGMDLGLPGVTAYVALLISVVFVLARVHRRSGDPMRRMLAVGILGSLAAMLVHGISDAVTWGTKLSFLPWMLFALAMLVARRQRDEIV
ncbi:hypothetical protein GC175_11340 [bacterium]|nr:hypothetical protein [bacterium]